MKRENIVGLSMKGGRRDNFFLCLLEFFPKEKRWFLSKLLCVKEVDGRDGDETIKEWAQNYGNAGFVVDFPLTAPACYTCQLTCPGAKHCPEPSIVEGRGLIEEILKKDADIERDNPKKYEETRRNDALIDKKANVINKTTNVPILSRSFKRRLKKGLLPYWNRALDFQIWSRYHDQLLQLFNVSFDSFGTTSLMVHFRFDYLKRHFPGHLKLFESYVPIILIELLRRGMLLERDIRNLLDVDLGIESRLDIIKKIEHSQNIFIYNSDLETLCRNPRAFDSFLLGVAGQNNLLKKAHLQEYPNQNDLFIIPQFF